MQPKRAGLREMLGLDVPVHVVDVGANPIDGEPPYAAMLRAGGTTLTGFEPNPAALARLLAAAGAGETYLPHAVGDGGRHRLHLCQAAGMTSLLEPDPAVLGLFHGFPEWGRVVATEEVQTRRLDEVAEALGADLLKIDIQGGELMALRHAGAVLAKAVAVQAEVEFLPLYKGQPLFGEVDAHLRGLGFVLHRFHPATSRAIAPMVVGDDIYAGLSQLVWADAVYVRDFTRVAAWPERLLLAGARVMHECYGSFDLVLHLLNEVDRRRGGGLGPAYLLGLRGPGRLAA